MPEASVIIPSRARPELLLEAVRTILAGDQTPSELVVMDQSDVAHPTLKDLKPERCEIRYCRCEPRGASYARNQGVRLARYDLLVFTDDDVLVERGWLGALVKALVTAGPYVVVTGQVRPADAEVDAGFVPSTRTDTVSRIYTHPQDADALYSGNMALHRAAIEKVGLFDERLGPGTRFRAAEDNDLGFRLLEAGYCIQYVPEAVLYHRSWRSTRDYAPLRWGYGLGRGAFYAKHLGRKNPHVLRRLLTDVRQHVVSSLWNVRSNRRQALGDVALAAGIVLGAGGWLLGGYRSNRSVPAGGRRVQSTWRDPHD
jgi:GT2 family glycosyltransferase